MEKPFSLYLGGAFAQFTPADVLARQAEIVEGLDALIKVYRPKHQGAYPPELGTQLEAVLTTRDRLLFQRADLIVLDFLGAKDISRGSVLEMGWANAFGKPLVLIAEAGNPHLFNMSRTVADFVVGSRGEAVAIANAILT